ncbi:YraN family protein [Tateyamaria sp.]|uniref:YraN family protein n=1 Tax=Tateyamaria sp. TaxID=1929288 RepID=UPI00329E1CA5
MTFAPRVQDFDATTPVVQAQISKGRTSYLAGLAAEDCVAAQYVALGYVPLETRWRGRRGEIDLIFADGDDVVMVEVKKSKDFDTAMSRITRAQVQRLFVTGEEYLGTCPRGSLTDVRFDVALVDRHGQVSVLENAFAAWI